MSRLLKTTAKCLVAPACLAALIALPVQAERAGVAGAVNASTHGTPPGGKVRQILLGHDVLHNETIETDAGGQAQILMLDRTALTIGPNSTLVIDKFIYDPDTKDGELSLTLRRGLLRFTGGALSKKRPVGVRTPVATVGIRGGMALLQVVSPGQTNAGFLFGNEMTVQQDGGVVQRIARAGFGTAITSNGPSVPTRWTADRMRSMMAALQGQAGRDGGLGKKVDRAQANAAAGEAVPAQDAQTLNNAIDLVLSNTETLQSGVSNNTIREAERTRQFNDQPRQEIPDFYAFLFNCLCFTREAPAGNLWDISIPFESFDLASREQLIREGFVGVKVPTGQVPIDQLQTVQGPAVKIPVVKIPPIQVPPVQVPPTKVPTTPAAGPTG